MNVNTNYWRGVHSLTGDIKYCDFMSDLATAGILTPNQPIDESIFMFACTNDKLCRHAFVKVERDLLNPNVIKITDKEYTPAISNYYPSYNGSGGSGSGATYWSPNWKRVGMDATISNVPTSAPFIEMKSKYLTMCIYVAVRTISNVTIDAAGTKHFTVTGYSEMTYDEYKTNYIDGLGTTNIIVGMFARFYYGNATNRNEFVTIKMSCSSGNVAFGIPAGMVDDNTTNINYPDRKILLDAFTQSTWLYQGGYTSTGSLNAGKNTILYFPFTNTLYWNFGVLGSGIGDYVISSYIDDVAGLTFAYSAYSATGFWYFGNVTDARTYNLDGDIDPTIAHRGKVDSEGKVNADASATDNRGLTDIPSDMHSATGYSGNENVDPNNYTDETPLTKPTLSTVSAFNRTFAVNYTAIRGLADWLWNADETVFDEIIAGLGLMGERPIEGIIDIRMYPFDVATLLTTAGEQVIKIGRTDSPVRGLIISTADNAVIDLGSCTFTNKFKSFLDYSPYTEARLYIPYCGVIPIDTAEFMGHEISAKMIVDIVTGACTVLIYKDKIITYYAQGSCGVSIPFTGTDSAQFAQSVLGSVINGATDIVGGGLSGDAGRIAGGAGELFSGFATPVQYATGGSSTPSCGNWQPQYAYFIIDRPAPIPPNDYGHCVGYACEIYDTLSNFSGYTVINNADLSGFAATETEKQMIRQLMQEGIYL